MKNENKKLWYAVLQDSNDGDWGHGSFDHNEAVVMCALLFEKERTPQIAFIDGHYDEEGNATTDTICVGEQYINEYDLFDLPFNYQMDFLEKAPSWDFFFVEELINKLCDYYEIDQKNELGEWYNGDELLKKIKEAHDSE